MPSFYEFFAGAGMARAGLGKHWTCLFANDFDTKKALVYQHNWGGSCMVAADIRNLTAESLPGKADLIWASFPCQDLSLAGGGAGLKGDRSGTFWPFWNLFKDLVQSNRGPQILVLENVCGTLTSHKGRDFTAICQCLSDAGCVFGAVIVDAVEFVPQSRPRLFIIAVRDGDLMHGLKSNGPTKWHSMSLRKAYSKLDFNLQKHWVWWDMPSPESRNIRLADIIEESPEDVKWHSADETEQLLKMMSELNLAKVEKAKLSGVRKIGGVYKRTRIDHDGNKVQRAEVRFDDIAGCLRTPAGGSSRQLLLFVEGSYIRSRLLSSREAARLMGLPDSYILPNNYNEAYHLLGDGVVVSVVRHLAKHIFEPVINATVSEAVA